MTTDQLVKEIIDAFQAGDASHYDLRPYDKFMNEIDYDEPSISGRYVALYSVALNDETRDIRYIEVHGGGTMTRAFEVRPRTVLRTIYEAV